MEKLKAAWTERRTLQIMFCGRENDSEDEPFYGEAARLSWPGWLIKY